MIALHALGADPTEPAACPAAEPTPLTCPAAAEPPLPQVRPRTPQARRGTVGFRNGMVGQTGAMTRAALVLSPDRTTITEITLRGQLASRWLSLGIEVPATSSSSPLWSSAGLGNTQLDGRVLFGGVMTQAVGVSAILPSGGRSDPRGAIGWWGTVPHATIPTIAVLLAWEGATDRWAFHIHSGMRTDAWFATDYSMELFDISLNVATVQPVSPRLSLIAELEALTNIQSPVHLRGFVRYRFGAGLNADLGLAFPVLEFARDPTLQLIGSLRWTLPNTPRTLASR